MGYSSYVFLFGFCFLLAYIAFESISKPAHVAKIRVSSVLSTSNYLILIGITLVFIYLSGLKNQFLSYSPGSDSDLFIKFLDMIINGHSTPTFEIYFAAKKQAFLNLLSPLYQYIEAGSLASIILLITLNLLFVSMICKRIIYFAKPDDKNLFHCLIILCPLTALLMVSYLRDIFAVFLVIELAYLFHLRRFNPYSVTLILFFSLLLFYTRSFYLVTLYLGVLVSIFSFRTVLLAAIPAVLLIVVFVDIKPILIKLLVLHGRDAAKLGGSALTVGVDGISDITPLFVIKRLALGFFTMLATPQPGFILNDLVNSKGDWYRDVENVFQLVFSVIYVGFLLPITACIVLTLDKHQLTTFKNSRFHFAVLTVLVFLFAVYSIKYFGVRHFKVDYARYILWLAALTFFPVKSLIKSKLFFVLSGSMLLLAYLVTLFVVL